MDPISNRRSQVSGVTVAVVALALAAVTAVALAVIFAPPFFATAALAGCAVYLAIGCGAGTVAATALALFLLMGKKQVGPPLKSDEQIVSDYTSPYCEEYIERFSRAYQKGKSFAEQNLPEDKQAFDAIMNDLRKDYYRKDIDSILNRLERLG